MTDIMAALGLVQFERYSGILQRRYDIVARYNEALKDLPVAVLNHKGHTEITDSINLVP